LKCNKPIPQLSASKEYFIAKKGYSFLPLPFQFGFAETENKSLQGGIASSGG